MASNYSPTELDGSGILLKENFTSGSTYTITVANKPSSNSCYLFMETKHPTASPLPLYFSGSTLSGSFALGAVYDDYTQGINIIPGGVTEIEWTPSVNVTGANVYIKATGNISCSITA